MDNKVEQLIKEAKERGYTHDNFKCLINRGLEGTEDVDKWYYDQFSDTLYTMPDGKGGNVIYRNGIWAEIISSTLEQQLRKAEAEVYRLKKAIEEENKIKVGDKVYVIVDDLNLKVILNSDYEKNK